jgi:hypothetical protein
MVSIAYPYSSNRSDNAAVQDVWLAEVASGLSQIAAEQTVDARQSIAVLQKRSEDKRKAFQQRSSNRDTR